MMEQPWIHVRGARTHNLKNIDVKIPRNKLVIITGLSGSGKSSLAFDTIYAEGQRRYVESLSTYARQFLEQMEKPDVDSIEGLSPAISIDQRKSSNNPRSTVATVTEIYDYLRLLFARIGTPFCPNCDVEISSQSASQITDQIMQYAEGTKIHILGSLVRGRKGEYSKELKALLKKGFTRVKIDGQTHELGQEIHLNKNTKHTIDVFVDRLVVKEQSRRRIADSVETALDIGEGIMKVEVVSNTTKEILFSQKFSCLQCGFSFEDIAPRMFSFNSPYGACAQCDGLGTKKFIDPDLIVPNPNLSLQAGAILPWQTRFSFFHMQTLEALAKHYRFDLDMPWKKLPKKIQHLLLHGSQDETIHFKYDMERSNYSIEKTFEGVIPSLMRRFSQTDSEDFRQDIEEKFMGVVQCPDCKGARLKKEALSIKVDGLSIAKLCEKTIQEAFMFFQLIELGQQKQDIAKKILHEIRSRLAFLMNVGLDYLTLLRQASTLSGGEAQRIRLATQIGSSLVGVLYILDEPSIGLHQKDNDRLLETLTHLRDIGNTVIVVEHDEDTMLGADHIIDMGPGAGKNGGEVVACGTVKDIIQSKKSITGQYLSHQKSIETPKQRRKPGTKKLKLEGVTTNNLKNIDVSFPLGLFVSVTGVSGSGKSSLVIDTLFPLLKQHLYHSKDKAGQVKNIQGLNAIDKVIDIDQSPIGRTPRSNPVTYIGVFSLIRELFATLPESKARGYKPGRFSFNVKGGRCETCQGDGVLKIEMHFLPDVYVTCEMCRGKRYNRETLEVNYRNKSISEVLNMTVDEALEFFSMIPPIFQKIEYVAKVGLGYMQLGQSATTLSGGEAQRIKLAKELSKRSTGKTIYILDEPTTGLHFEDIKNLLEILQTLVDQGNTVIVIEHHLDVIKCADWIIDMGPDGGSKGGEVIATGTPEEVAKSKSSYTGQYLKKTLNLKQHAFAKETVS